MELIFATISKPMRKFFLTTAFLASIPFSLIFGLILVLLIYSQTARSITPDAITYAALPSDQSVLGVSITEEDGGNAEKIREYLARYNSPLEPYAVDLITAADEYGLDHRLLVAIAMQESTLCKKIPVGSNNCWGFGIYGKTVTRFADYREGIYTVSKALSTRYKVKGLVTPDQIMTMYTPSSNGSWAIGVNRTMKQLQ
jgi:hypothetical protein